jgi:hypothetical protein
MHPGPKAEVFKGILCSEGEDVDVELDDKHFGRGIRLEEFVWRGFVWRNSFGGIRLERNSFDPRF